MWLQCISRHSWQCPCISEVQVATQDARLKALECHYVSSNISSRVPDQDKGGMEKNNMLSLKGSLICLPGKSMIFFYKEQTEKNWEPVARPGWVPMNQDREGGGGKGWRQVSHLLNNLLSDTVVAARPLVVKERSNPVLPADLAVVGGSLAWLLLGCKRPADLVKQPWGLGLDGERHSVNFGQAGKRRVSTLIWKNGQKLLKRLFIRPTGELESGSIFKHFEQI